MDIHFGSWNVQTLLRVGKMEEVARELEKCNVSICAVQEVRWKDSGTIKKKNYDFHFSGSREARGHKGVGFYVLSKVKKSVLGFEPINERICKLRVKGKFCNITFVNVYAPTEDAEERTVDEFYEDLERAADRIPRHDMKVILGDFNAKIGKEDQYRMVAGKCGLHEQTSINGERVCLFAETQRLIISSTCFPHKSIHLGTWKIPGRDECNQIDHVLTSKRWATSVRDVRTLRGANCDSDHYLVKGVLRHRVANNVKVKITKTERWDVEKLNDVNIRQQFQENVREGLRRNESDLQVEERWTNLKETIKGAAELILGKVKQQRNVEWFDEECRLALDSKNRVRKKLLQARTRANTEDYRRERLFANRLLRRKKREAANKRIEDLEKNHRQNECRKFYKNMRSITDSFQVKSQVLLDEDGNAIVEKDEIKKRWKRYFEEVFKEQDLHLPGNGFEIPEMADQDVQPPEKGEIEEIIRKMKNNKSPGTDTITAEMLKNGGDTLVRASHELIQQVWNEETMPEEWKQGLIIPIYKKGDRRDCKNYRGITLLNVIYKIFSILIYNRLVVYGEREVSEYQCGFRTGRSTMDNIFMLRQIFEKCTEYGIEIHCAFVDFRQAFDRVNRESIGVCLRCLGVPQKLIRLVLLTLVGSNAMVRVHNENTDPFQVEAGVRQGDSLSALIFNLVLEAALRKVDCLGDISYRFSQMSAYADDIAVITRNLRTLLGKLEDIKREVSKVGLTINWDKTKYLRMTRARQGRAPDIEIHGNRVEAVGKFKYLGSVLTSDNNVSEEIRERIAAGGRCYFAFKKLLGSNSLHKEAKLKIYKTVIRPVVVYGGEAWTLTKQDTDRLRVFERQILRRICGPEIRQGEWRRRRNKDLLDFLQGEDIVKYIKAQRLRWLGHLERMDNTRAVKRIAEWIPANARPRGRPKKRWKDDVMTDLRRMGVRNWREVADDRAEWRLLIQQAKTHGGL